MTEETTTPKKTLANATVILEGKRNSFTNETGEKGKVDFNKLPPDTYTLLVKKEGYEEYIHPEPITIKEKKYNNQTLNIHLTPQQQEQKEQEEEEEEYTTRTIIIQTTPTIEEAEIQLISQDETIQTQTTDNTGTVTFNDIPYGSYTIKSNTTGYEEYTQNITINSNNKNPRTINISFTETTKTEE